MSVKLFSEQFGQGIPLTLLHGYPLDHTIWMDIVPYLEADARLILPDLRGFGKSPAPSGKYSMRAMAEDVVALLDSLDIEKTILGGHSMGGYIALSLLRHFPERVGGLILVASHAYADSNEKKEARLSSIQAIEKEGVLPIISPMSEKLTYNREVVEKCKHIILETIPAGVMGVLAGMADRQDCTDILSGSDMAMMIIAGQDDQFIPIETSRKMAEMMKVPRLVEIPKAGHLPMLDQPEETASALRSFIFSL
jgi:pimeloyl-ACP methyl ester carboxylesterase